MDQLPVIIGVGGFASNVGKTTLMCELLKELPGWEAIKITRGHYRSCGKDPHSCCVSHLLGDAPVIRSGKTQTYAVGKDTGRYWDAGATNVHWLIAAGDQLATGVSDVLQLVKAPGVLIEGNSFSKYVKPDLMIVVPGGPDTIVKKTAREVLSFCDSIYSPFPMSVERFKTVQGIAARFSPQLVLRSDEFSVLLDQVRRLACATKNVGAIQSQVVGTNKI
jgi:molybdopterin-guanine dinucleotide biosynthesis protein